MSKYEEALERARKHYRETPNNVYKAMLEQIFPDIEENEDKKIKKEIINYFRCQNRDEPTRKETHNRWIAWIEKQGNSKSINIDIDAMVKEYKERLIMSGASCINSPLINKYLTVFRQGIENTLDELNLRNFINKK